jgi:hypothetical protein
MQDQASIRLRPTGCTNAKRALSARLHAGVVRPKTVSNGGNYSGAKAPE